MVLKRKRRVNEGIVGPEGGEDADSHSEGAKASGKEHLPSS